MFKGIKEAVEMIHRTLTNNGHITIYGDYDVDGLNGLLCFKDFLELLEYTNYSCVEYTNRTHSVDRTVRSVVLANNSSLCVIIDTGSSDVEELQSIVPMCDVLVADHHNGILGVVKPFPKCVFVNPTILDSFSNLSGACVIYEVCMAYFRKYKVSAYALAEKYLTFYAFAALYADSIYNDNSYCRDLYDKATRCILPSCFSNLKYFNISKRFILFSFAPPINACFRNNMFYVLNSLYLRKTRLLSVDRNNLLLDMDNIRSHARTISEILVNKCTKTVIGNFVLADLSGLLNQSIPNNLIWCNKGLIANKIADMYKRCCICVVSTGTKYVLSCRDYYNRDMYRLFSTLYNIGGHKSAFGGDLTFQEVLDLKDKLKILSDLVDPPNPVTIFEFNDLSLDDIDSVIWHNEFNHEKDLKLIRVPTSQMNLTWTPQSFAERYEQYVLKLRSDVYIKIEDFARNKDAVLLHLFKSNRTGGTLVEER